MSAISFRVYFVCLHDPCFPFDFETMRTTQKGKATAQKERMERKHHHQTERGKDHGDHRYYKYHRDHRVFGNHRDRKAVLLFFIEKYLDTWAILRAREKTSGNLEFFLSKNIVTLELRLKKALGSPHHHSHILSVRLKHKKRATTPTEREHQTLEVFNLHIAGPFRAPNQFAHLALLMAFLIVIPTHY